MKRVLFIFCQLTFAASISMSTGSVVKAQAPVASRQIHDTGAIISSQELSQTGVIPAHFAESAQLGAAKDDKGHLGKTGYYECSPSWVGGIDYLLIRPHFSEAMAFARGTQTPTTFRSDGEELQFDYQSSVRAFIGRRAADGLSEWRVSYAHYDGDVEVGGSAAELGLGQFLVDPFGNIVGTAVVIDPSDARFNTPGGVLTGGDRIATRAVVEVNTYDMDFVRYRPSEDPNWLFQWSAGVRLADVDQSYESTITQNGSFFSYGDFSVDFVGAGPRMSVGGRRFFGADGRLSLLAQAGGSMLVGNYDVRSSNTVTTPVPFRAEQRETPTRLITVWEAEVGSAWDVTDSIQLSTGWLFHAWTDMGTSGGHFGGFFSGADDGNLMSFDGLFARVQAAY